MKKILMNAAVVTMMLASCTNEELVNQGADGRMFTLEVTKGANSRTALDGLQTVWSEGDKIYVTSEDGKTTGVLTLDPRDAGKPSGSFSGYVFGKGELKYSVYPVPTQEGLNLGAADVNKLDAPMTGEINAGTASFVNSCGLVKLNILGLGNDDVVKVSGAEVGSVMEYDLATNSWVKKSAGSTISITGAQDATEFFVPVYTTNTTATDVELSVSVNGGNAQKVTVPVAVKKVNPETPILAVTSSTGAVVDPSTADVKDLGDDYIYIDSVEELYNALGINGYSGTAKDGAYIVLKKDKYEIDYGNSAQLSVTKNLTIVGNGATLVGGYTPGIDNPTTKTQTRPIYIYCGMVDYVKIQNLSFEQVENRNIRLTLWFSGNKPIHEVEPDSPSVTDILLENVAAQNVRIEHGYIDRMNVNVEIHKCNFSNMILEAWENKYINFKHDETSDFELDFGSSSEEGKKNITIEKI